MGSAASIDQGDHLGVQRQVAVLAELADRDMQPGPGADEHDRVSLQAELSRSRNDTLYVAANLSVLGFMEVSRGSFAAALPPLREARDLTHRIGIREPGVFRWHQDHIEASLAGGFPEEAAELVGELNAQAAALGRPGL